VVDKGRCQEQISLCSWFQEHQRNHVSMTDRCFSKRWENKNDGRTFFWIKKEEIGRVHKVIGSRGHEDERRKSERYLH